MHLRAVPYDVPDILKDGLAQLDSPRCRFSGAASTAKSASRARNDHAGFMMTRQRIQRKQSSYEIATKG